MRSATRFTYLLLILLPVFLIHCQKSSDPAPKQTVEIQNVTTSDAVDADGDGFYSSFRINFFLDLNNGSKDVYLLLAVRFYDVNDTATYYQYFESSDITLQEDGSTNSWYIEVPPYSTDDYWLPQAAYDFLLVIFDSEDPDTRLAEVSASDLSTLQNIPIEPPENEVGVWISDAWFENSVDVDGDNYDSETWLWVDADAGSGLSANVFLFYYYKPSGTFSWIPIGYTDSFTITGTNSGDDLGVKVTDLVNFPHDAYDFKAELIMDESVYVEDYADPSNDGSLGNVLLELPGEDVVIQTISFWDVTTYSYVDNDADGYYSEIVFEVDVDASTGSANVYMKVYSKGYLDANYIYLGDTNVFTITGNSSSDVYYIRMTANTLTFYDFRFELLYSGSSVVRDVRDASNDSDLNNVPLEDASTD